MNHQLLLDISIIFSLVAGTVFLGYVVTIILPFVRRKPEEMGDPAAYDWHFVVPCRDEEAVIGETIAYLRETFPAATVWVVDDDSEDATAAIVREAAAELGGVELIQRRRPNARIGKAHALNHAWSIIRETIPADERDSTILAVVDADGRPSANLLEVAAGPELFGTPKIGAVQVEVRMSNRVEATPLPNRGRLANLLARTFVRMQDLEFRGPISAIQMSRRYTGTVNVGGNGQLTRLSALDDIAEGEGPWRGSLLEDFELGLHFLLGGWKNAYTTAAWVDQEALYSLRRYIVQRARWSQGTMQCFRYLPKIWGSSRLGNLGAMELSYFLMQPWVQVLGTILYPVPLIAMIVNAASDPYGMVDWLAHGGAWLLAVYLVVGVGEFAIWGVLYRLRCEPEATWRAALGWGLGYLVYVYLIYVIAWRAVIQLVRRQTGWAKTIRNAETVEAGQLVSRTS
ncbi:glycosyltransferase family 2 protein [Leifsonia shinshuensis]|uniref:Glycosyltransferase family 2 protein n=1 Tax=Leifsonia shinshuensis TaxID=150026 RepID=A0A7G6Y9W9_9MICO|nr:glycosyltransferase family 2 protein [Leifsonia shinshuensis]QNE35284.1 glycosyltransferase family 2 protein [Leifsonia shinshuensis]